MPDSIADRLAPRASTPLAWETEMRLVTNGHMLGTMALACFLAAGIMALLLTFIFATQREWQAIPPILAMAGGTGLFLFVLSLLVMALVFGDRFRVRYTLDDDGVLFEAVDRRGKAANRLAFWVGVLAGKPGVAGAGLAAAASETLRAGWHAVQRAAFDPRRRRIALFNRWRRFMTIYATPETYAAAAALVARRVAATAGARPKGGNPLPKLLAWTVGVLAAATPMFMMPYPFELDLFVPILLVAFALAAVWLIGIFGWVVIGALAYVWVAVVLAGIAPKTSGITGRTYRSFEILDSNDIVALALLALGSAFLLWFAWRGVRGRLPSALATDMDEMDDAKA
jgi:hypothetical protein